MKIAAGVLSYVAFLLAVVAVIVLVYGIATNLNDAGIALPVSAPIITTVVFFGPRLVSAVALWHVFRWRGKES